MQQKCSFAFLLPSSKYKKHSAKPPRQPPEQARRIDVFPSCFAFGCAKTMLSSTSEFWFCCHDFTSTNPVPANIQDGNPMWLHTMLVQHGTANLTARYWSQTDPSCVLAFENCANANSLEPTPVVRYHQSAGDNRGLGQGVEQRTSTNHIHIKATPRFLAVKTGKGDVWYGYTRCDMPQCCVPCGPGHWWTPLSSDCLVGLANCGHRSTVVTTRWPRPI